MRNTADPEITKMSDAELYLAGNYFAIRYVKSRDIFMLFKGDPQNPIVEIAKDAMIKSHDALWDIVYEQQRRHLP